MEKSFFNKEWKKIVKKYDRMAYMYKAYAYLSLYTYIHQSATIKKYKTPLNYPSEKHQKEPAWETHSKRSNVGD